MKILVIVPAYNEEDAIIDTIKNIGQMKAVDILVINDASVDRTRKLLFENNVEHIDLPLNLGIGGGVQTGYIYAVENDYDIAVQMDGDGQHPVEELEKLLMPIVEDEADIVIGSRFITKEGFQSSKLRRLGIKFLSMLIYLCTGTQICDVTSGYRAVGRKFIKKFADEYAQDYPEPESIVLAAKENARIKEIPVVMKERQGGTSSISPLQSLYYMVKVSIAIIIRSLSN